MNLGASTSTNTKPLSPLSDHENLPLPTKCEAQKESSIPKVFEERTKAQNGLIRRKIYLIGKKLGRGAFAECYECLDTYTEMIYAVKIVKKSMLLKSRIRQKVNFLEAIGF